MVALDLVPGLIYPRREMFRCHYKSMADGIGRPELYRAVIKGILKTLLLPVAVPVPEPPVDTGLVGKPVGAVLVDVNVEVVQSTKSPA